jgi:hypothetical protein
MEKKRKMGWRWGLILALVWGCVANATGVKHPPRDYFRGVAETERRNIHYIVDVLAHKNLASIWMHQNDLNAAGDQLASMHPFRFLEVLLVDPKVKSGVVKIRDRSMVWPNFYEGIRGSLQHESARHNLTEEQVQDFARTVHADVGWVHQMILHHRWKDLVEGLFVGHHR